MSTPDRDMVKAGVAEQLDQCPVCNYCLRGLPAPHRCPECGFVYDEHTHAWKPRRFLHFAGWPLLLFAAYNILLSGSRLLRHSLLPERISNDIMGMNMWTAALLVLVWIYRRRPFVAVTPRGVVMRRWSGVRIVPWNCVRKAVPNEWSARSVTLVVVEPATGDREPLPKSISLRGLATNREEVGEFVKAVEGWVRRVKKDQDGT